MRGAEAILQGVRSRLGKHRALLRRKWDERRLGPQGEARSEITARKIVMVPLQLIQEDPKFQNVRLQIDEEKLLELMESLQREGMRQPITVIELPPGSPGFYLRAGFRRVAAARKLRWQRVPAIVLPHDTPAIDERWVNIIENSHRSNLTTYEIACAARLMRDEFGVSPQEFGVRAGYSEPYVHKLLRCIDKLPPEIKDVWRDQAPIPIDVYHRWTSLEPGEAARELVAYSGHNPRVAREWRPPDKIREKVHPARMATARGLARMQRLRLAVEVASPLSERERTLCVRVIDFCAGARGDVPEIYEERKKKPSSDDQPREDLPPLTELEDAALPPPKED